MICKGVKGGQEKVRTGI